jgi:hypothetical protein
MTCDSHNTTKNDRTCDVASVSSMSTDDELTSSSSRKRSDMIAITAKGTTHSHDDVDDDYRRSQKKFKSSLKVDQIDDDASKEAHGMENELTFGLDSDHVEREEIIDRAEKDSEDLDVEEDDDDDDDNEEDCEELIKGISMLQECIQSYQHERELLNAEQQNQRRNGRIRMHHLPTGLDRQATTVCHDADHLVPPSYHPRPISPSGIVAKITPCSSQDDLISFLVEQLVAVEHHSIQHLLSTSGLQS